MKITLDVPSFEETINGVAVVIDPSRWSEDQATLMVAGAYLQGLRIILQRSTASADDPKKAIKEKADALQKGDYNFGRGGGGGSRQTPEDKAWIAYFVAIQHQEGGKPVNGKTLRRAQETLCRKAILAEHDLGSDARKHAAENMGDLLENRIDGWITEQEETNPVLRMGIEYQKALAAMPTMK